MEQNLFVILSGVLFLGLLIGTVSGVLLAKKTSATARGRIAIRASSVSGRGAFAAANIKEGDIIERCPALEVSDRDIGGELVNYVFYGNTETDRLVVMGY